ncbi:uncharacterized protein LOC131635757 [Vicia villosa]|uniref:uncharacterized protein LOC131635757 n=1 Tax=Vicia villosa TaxID=3911 RepID=UPI00273B1D1C|nr:uncharacterized protein LOC131635757 [Vicia villosa]
MTKRTSEREVEQPMKASSVKKDQKQKRHGRSQKSEVCYYNKEKYQKGKEKYDNIMVQCYYCNKFGHFSKDCWSNKEEGKIAKGDFDDESVLLIAYESDEEPSTSQDDFKYDSESEDDSETEDKSKSEGDYECEGKSKDELESEEEYASKDKSKPEGSEDQSEPESSKDKSESEGASKEEEDSEGESDYDGESISNPDFDDDSESGCDDVSGREKSEDVGSGGQAFEDDHVSSVNRDSEGGTSEGRASEGSPASDGGRDSEGKASEGDPNFECGTSEGSGFGRGPEVNKGVASCGSRTSKECLEGDTIQESEEDSEQLCIEEALKKKV